MQELDTRVRAPMRASKQASASSSAVVDSQAVRECGRRAEANSPIPRPIGRMITVTYICILSSYIHSFHSCLNLIAEDGESIEWCPSLDKSGMRGKRG